MEIDGEVRWEIVGSIEVDGACCGFGDATAASVTRSVFLDRVDWDGEVYDFDARGVPFVAANTKVDASFPVEVSHDRQGGIAAARIYFTDDADDLPGSWHGAGTISITSGSCIAADPFNMAESATSMVSFPVTNGPAKVEVFLHSADDDENTDLLGIRVTFAR